MKRIISLCDGAAVGLEAASKAFEGEEIYYEAVEINQAARTLADHNHPGRITRRFHDVCDLVMYFWQHFDEESLEFDLTPVKDEFFFDYIIMGPPCVSLSSQGSRTDWTGASGLFWHCLKIYQHLKRINPDIKILMENVKSMKNKIRDEISAAIELPYFIGNSALTSGQARDRYYWFNWAPPNIIDKKIMANDILDGDGVCLYSFSRSYRYKKNEAGENVRTCEGRMRKDGKAGTLTTGMGCNGFSTMNRVITEKMKERNLTIKECQKLMNLERYDFSVVSPSAAYEILGNGWEAGMITELLKASA